MISQIQTTLGILFVSVTILSSFTTDSRKEYLQDDDIKTVDLGGSVWMTENLNVSKFKNGDSILHAATLEDWKKANESSQPAWCYADNLSTNGEIYGKLYNWFAVNDPRGLAPNGWHIPTDDEWIGMENHIGGRSGAGTKMKSTEGWGTNDQSTNESGFSGLPGGILRYEDTVLFERIGTAGYWWSATSIMNTKAFIRILENENVDSRRFFIDSKYGASVRCVIDK